MQRMNDGIDQLTAALDAWITHANRFGLLCKRMGTELDNMGTTYQDAVARGEISMPLALAMVGHTIQLMGLVEQFEEYAHSSAEDSLAVKKAIITLFGPVLPDDNPKKVQE